MNKKFRQIGIKDETLELVKVSDLIDRKLIEKPMDGNHGEIHPKGNDFVSSGIPFVMASDIKNGRINFDSCKYISEKQADNLRKGFAKNGDILVTHKATIGETAIVEYVNHPYIMLTPQVTYYRVRDKSKINNRYLKLYFDTSFFQQTLAMWAGAGSTRAYLGITAQHNLPVLLPTIEKQNKIAAILSAYDDLIENNKNRIALLENMAEQIYREWFMRFRFPAHKTVKFEKGIPKTWNIKSLGKLIEDIIDYRGITPAKLGGEWANEGIPAISALNVKNGNLIKLDETKKVSERLYEKWMRKQLLPLDILLTSEAPLGQVHLLLEKEKYVLSQRLFGIRSDSSKISPIYLYFYLLFEIGQHQIQSKATGSTVGGIRQQLLRKIDILVPTHDLLKKFDEAVFDILKQAALLKKINANLEETKKSILPRLIYGKLSVEDLKIKFPPSMLKSSQAL